MSQFDCFLNQAAIAINESRQKHLESLNLNFANKKVLEVGAGIGLHTDFFLRRGCEVVITEGFDNNVEEIKKRHPSRPVFTLDLEADESLSHLGRFDVVYCYGLLYHLRNAEIALKRLSEVCDGQILLETICSLAQDESIKIVQDGSGNNQSIIGVGCRPSRLWVLNKLRTYFGNSYISKTQPDHHDFPTDWSVASYPYNTRAIFVGSKTTIKNTNLITEPLTLQERFIQV